MSITLEEAQATFTRVVEAQLERPAPAQELQEVLALFKLKQLPKGHTIKAPDTVGKYVSFLLSGCVRHYAVLPNGNDVTVRVIEAQTLVADGQSLADQTPSILAIETTEDSTLLMAELPAYMQLLNTSLTLNIITRKIAIQQGLDLGKRFTSFLSSTAAERYAFIMEHYPSLLHRLPLQMIASFIGVTPTQLSRIRRSLLTPFKGKQEAGVN